MYSSKLFTFLEDGSGIAEASDLRDFQGSVIGDVLKIKSRKTGVIRKFECTSIVKSTDDILYWVFEDLKEPRNIVHIYNS